ncbi:hypothetical protein KCU95_g7539, partial [Aureobasidium melanogenum]
MATKGRSLDLLERFQLAQARAGSVPYITIIGLMVVTPTDLVQILAEMAPNIDELMRIHPILVAGIDDTDIRRPKWRPNNDNPPFETNDPMVHPIIESGVFTVQSIAQVAEAEEAEAQGFNLANGPLWRIGVYELGNQPLSSYCVALTVHHIVTDNVSHISVDFGKDQNRIVERLEALGHQIGTVHSVLHTAAVVALAAAVATGNDTFDTIGTETPKSLRSEDRNHPRIGGNYTGMVERSIPLAKLKSETIASFTKKTNSYIHSPEAESDARSRVGEFRLMPDRIIPDSWKARLTERGTSENPFRNSLMISNLGRFQGRHIPGLEKVWFCHASMPWGAAINMDVVSLNLRQPSDVSGRREARLAVMVSWLDGAIEREVIDRFCAALVRVVNLLARAGGAPNLDRHAMRARNLQDLVN